MDNLSPVDRFLDWFLDWFDHLIDWLIDLNDWFEWLIDWLNEFFCVEWWKMDQPSLATPCRWTHSDGAEFGAERRPSPDVSGLCEFIVRLCGGGKFADGPEGYRGVFGQCLHVGVAGAELRAPRDRNGRGSRTFLHPVWYWSFHDGGGSALHRGKDRENGGEFAGDESVMGDGQRYVIRLLHITRIQFFFLQWFNQKKSHQILENKNWKKWAKIPQVDRKFHFFRSFVWSKLCEICTEIHTIPIQNFDWKKFSNQKFLWRGIFSVMSAVADRKHFPSYKIRENRSNPVAPGPLGPRGLGPPPPL